MFMWDDIIPTTLSPPSTSQLKVNISMRAATLCSIELFANSSCWTSPSTGMITVRGEKIVFVFTLEPP